MFFRCGINAGGNVSFEADLLSNNTIKHYIVTRMSTPSSSSASISRAKITSVTNGVAELLKNERKAGGSSLYLDYNTYLVTRTGNGTISFNTESNSLTTVVAVKS